MKLITTQMISDSLVLLPALVLDFMLGDFAFGKVNEIYFKRLVIGITIAAGMMLIFSTM